MIRAFLHIMLKDAIQLLRTPVLLGLLVLCPAIAIGLVPFGLENKVNLHVLVVDESFSEAGREVVRNLNASPQLKASQELSMETAQELMDKGKADATVLITADGSYSILPDASHAIQAMDASEIISRQLFRTPEDNGVKMHTLFVSGSGNTHYYLTVMLILLMSIIGCCLVGLSIINEKVNRQLEYYRSVGMSPTIYITSKLTFHILVTLLELGLGLLVGRLVFGYEVLGPLPAFFLLAACFLFCVINLGVLMAVVSKTLIQTVYGIIFLFFVLMLLGTMFAPVDNMTPFWAATRYLNPFFWTADAGWKIALRGFSIREVLTNVLALLTQGTLLTVVNIRLLAKNGW